MTLSNLSATNFLKLWYVYDKDRSSYLEKNEIRVLVKDLVEKSGCDAQSVEEHEAKMIEEYDTNRDGKIHISELSKVIGQDADFITSFQSLSVDDFERVFQLSDEDGNGTLENDEIPQFLKNLFPEGSSDQIETYKNILEALCESQEGKLTKNDLKILFH
ncbi:calbindin isoform X1 [Hydra vulgaris]|uniref:calbindin isoform X1 n=1 Tax=Hydra vulgaris TaxID=6087 RepID=UPI0001924A79|nr:calbindin [Hydra vulgaris]